jgi:hypothetical protein
MKLRMQALFAIVAEHGSVARLCGPAKLFAVPRAPLQECLMIRTIMCLAAAVLMVGTATAKGAKKGAMTDKGTLTLYEGQKYDGEFEEVIKTLPSLNMMRTVGSVGVFPGEKWELCEGLRYKPPCNIFSDSVGDLGRITIRSVRQIKQDVPKP